MKGLVFTEFLEMVEQKFGLETADHILDSSDLPSGGIYTAVGTYDYGEMVTLLQALSQKTGLAIPDLLYSYGHYLFATFQKGYPAFLNFASSAFDFLESIDKHIHVEVKKLYPEAELPTFHSKRLSDSELELVYESERKMGTFALGLIEKSLEHYQEKASVIMENMRADGSQVRFVIKK